MIENDDRKTLREMPYPYNLIEVVKGQGLPYGVSEEVLSLDYTPSAIRAMVSETLAERETQVIEMRYRDKMTLAEVGTVFGVGQERIRQIEAKALRKLNHPARLRNYAAVPYQEWKKEYEARLRAEARLDWYLQHGRYTVELEESDKPFSDNPELYDTPIDDMDFSVRSFNCLKRAMVNTLGDILKLDFETATHIRNLGRRSLDEIVSKVHERGLLMSWEREDG